MPINSKVFGKFLDKDIVLTQLSSENKFFISVMNWGAAIQDWKILNNDNKPTNIVLGFEKFDFYPAHSPFFGAIIGRVINRISKGEFNLNRSKFNLPVNRPPNHLHGGPEGFGTSLWDMEINKVQNSVTFYISSKDGHQGYPGNVDASVKYTLSGDCLSIEMLANTDRPTPINMGQHNYFNLSSINGINSDYNICNHQLYINSSSYTETNKDLIPTGNFIKTKNSSMDFSKFKKINKIKLDDNFVLNENFENETAAELYNPQNGLQLKLWTNQPGLQVFNAPMMNIKPPGLNNLKYSSFAGICLEAQKFPDSVNQHHFPSIIIEPNQSYYQKTEISVNFT